MFCINGDCDSGAYGEHRLSLNAHALTSNFINFREGQCHNLNVRPIIADPWYSLVPGTEEHDTTSENDSWFVILDSHQWYHPTCDTYQIRASKEFKGGRYESVCWDFGGQVTGVTAGSSTVAEFGATFNYQRCSNWFREPETFEWLITVEPYERW